jgi:hypothetical protein
MSKLTIALVLAAYVVAGFPRAGCATNYREYKKFDVAGPTNERVQGRGRIDLKGRCNHHRCETWWKF